LLNILIKPLEASDWERVKEIYLEGLATGDATFETKAPTQVDWDNGHLRCCRIAAVDMPANLLVGWAALSPISVREAYKGVAEVSVYVAASARGKGVGRALLQRLIEEANGNQIWTLQASIFPENDASIMLHESLGFRTVGHRERIAKLNGVWRNTVILERRSDVVGLD
jgi:phosphinothricin acetyltransferase